MKICKQQLNVKNKKCKCLLPKKHKGAHVALVSKHPSKFIGWYKALSCGSISATPSFGVKNIYGDKFRTQLATAKDLHCDCDEW